MRLNKQDGGRRQCISVTNNEVGADEQANLRKKGLRPGDAEWEQWGICDYITKPRIAAAVFEALFHGDDNYDIEVNAHAHAHDANTLLPLHDNTADARTIRLLQTHRPR